MKKNRGNESVGVINIYMEISQENSLCSTTFISNKQKCRFFLFFLSCTKSESRRVGSGSSWGAGWRHGRSGRGEVAGKAGRRVNTAQKMCTYVCQYENGTC
jgi:hypothetical protein